MEIFCQSQIYAKGDRKKSYVCEPDDKEAQIFCTAHLSEAIAFPCPYDKNDIMEIDNRKRIAHKTKEGKLEGFCHDFEIVEENIKCQNQEKEKQHIK